MVLSNKNEEHMRCLIEETRIQYYSSGADDRALYREKPMFSVGRTVDTLGLVRRLVTARGRGAAATTGSSRELKGRNIR